MDGPILWKLEPPTGYTTQALVHWNQIALVPAVLVFLRRSWVEGPRLKVSSSRAQALPHFGIRQHLACRVLSCMFVCVQAVVVASTDGLLADLARDSAFWRI